MLGTIVKILMISIGYKIKKKDREKNMKFNKWLFAMTLSVSCVATAVPCIHAEAVTAKKTETTKTNTTTKTTNNKTTNNKTTTVQKKQVVISDYSAIFDANYYYNTYPDLQAAFGKDDAKLFEHFVKCGMKEGRVGNADFNVKAYMKNNLDLVGLFKADDLTEYYAHYANNGKAEGRIAQYQANQAPREGVLATHTTYYDPKESRAINVELAASRINGMVIEPGKVFSYSDSVGRRTVENGYVDGPSFANGKEVSSIGGGICQVSSTLYVSMLLSGIEPIEHHYHGLPVDYVPKGLDASIAENVQDLRFKNNSAYNVVIEASAKDGVLTVSLLRG